jgi:glycosyltransferase involved in cell wall biosynthesis
LPKQKVLIISQNFYPEIGSAGNRMKNIYQLLEREQYEVSVLTTEPSYPNKNLYSEEKFWTEDSINRAENVNRIKVSNRKYSFSMLNRLLYYIEVALKMLFFVLFDRKKYDFVFVSSPPIFIGFVGLIAKYRYRAKMILDIRDLWPESLKGVGVFNYKIIIDIFSLLETLLYKKANTIVVNSLGFIDYISDKAKIKKETIRFIPNGARVEEFLNQETQRGNEFRVIYTGNIGLAQDVDFLKELSLELSNQNISLSIVGYGLKRNELIQFTKDNNLSNVIFFAPATRRECLSINAEHDVGLISLNKKEVFDTVLPGKIMDYMLSGTPVVAAVSGYSKQLIEEFGTGFVSETRDTKEMLKYILSLKNSPEKRNEMKQNCLKVIHNKFLWEENIKTLVNIIEMEPIRQYSSTIKTKANKVEI